MSESNATRRSVFEEAGHALAALAELGLRAPEPRKVRDFAARMLPASRKKLRHYARMIKNINSS